MAHKRMVRISEVLDLCAEVRRLAAAAGRPGWTDAAARELAEKADRLAEHIAREVGGAKDSDDREGW